MVRLFENTVRVFREAAKEKRENKGAGPLKKREIVFGLYLNDAPSRMIRWGSARARTRHDVERVPCVSRVLKLVRRNLGVRSSPTSSLLPERKSVLNLPSHHRSSSSTDSHSYATSPYPFFLLAIGYYTYYYRTYHRSRQKRKRLEFSNNESIFVLRV